MNTMPYPDPPESFSTLDPNYNDRRTPKMLPWAQDLSDRLQPLTQQMAEIIREWERERGGKAQIGVAALGGMSFCEGWYEIRFTVARRP